MAGGAGEPRRIAVLSCMAILVGSLLAIGALGVLFWHLAMTAPHSLWIIGGLYVATIAAELLFSKRGCLCKRPPA